MKNFITRFTSFSCAAFRVVLRIIDTTVNALKVFKNPYTILRTVIFSSFVFTLVFVSLVQAQSALAHPGKTAKDGCHNDRKSGTRHCHGDRNSHTKSETQSNSKYERHAYGGWIDADKDGQNTRQEVLIEENIGTLVLSPDGKKVISGMWYDPYTNQTFTDPSDLDIDHFVPLKEAHISGAHRWSNTKKREYGNHLDDANHLIAVSKSANRSKGSRDPSEYLPPHKEYICQYVSTWVSIKEKWELDMDEYEKIAIAKQNNQCNK